MKKLRLLLWEECNRNCDGCCNKDWDLKSLPFITDFKGFDMILLTGGEPMLYPELVKKVIENIRKQSSAIICLYTAKVFPSYNLLCLLQILDGITITLHNQEDVKKFSLFLYDFYSDITIDPKEKSLRLNVFKDVNINELDVEGWEVKKDIDWIKNCPLPEGEILGRCSIF